MTSNPYVERIKEHADLIVEKRARPSADLIYPLANGRGLVLDVGCGNGSFIVDLASKSPDLFFVGVELKYKRLYKAAASAKKNSLQNVLFLQIKAETLADWFRPGSLNSLHVNFPDPWPKKRHRKNRFVNAETLPVFNALLKLKGRFRFKTDFEQYHDEVLGLLGEKPEWSILKSGPIPPDSSGEPEAAPTVFESKFISQGLPVFGVSAEKTAGGAI